MAVLADKTGGRVLVVDDEAALLKTFRYCLEDDGHTVATAASGEQAMALIRSRVFDVCFLDLSLGDSNALELLPAIRIAAPWLRVVIVTAHSSVDTAVQAMRAGATDYLVKPCSPEQLRIAAATHLHARRLDLRLEELERETGRSGGDTQLESRSPAMAALLDTVRQVAESEASILVLGESGTGKGVIARAIHRWSARQAAPFITINSPGLSGELFESELFGHRKGAFTGAVANSPGRVSQADGGTLFLDEIGEVPLALQPKLLRFLQDKQYESIGDPVTRQADVRLVAATNRDLNAMVRAGTFREDLLYRLDVIRIHLPPLRDRIEDLPQLAHGFLDEFIRIHRGRARGFSEAALTALAAHRWPGNIRELRNVVERASILCRGEQIEPRDLALGDAGGSAPATRTTQGLSLQALEREHILSVLGAAETLEVAAKTLGIDASTLYRKRKQYGI
ncbi:sigma-54 dependent transcriptional regulator [uncultured Nevskia sp.]|uniref:sigma-54-dependent transcriptional regulator n=1 Tax=uncultured Nevskia sp. TaxID=228950 RepID=UPI0025ED5366|nr:sigma-54 dependent transcriptional regulator [uncultured Nevskia sp.]